MERCCIVVGVCVGQVGLRGVEDVEAEDLLESACTIQLMERAGETWEDRGRERDTREGPTRLCRRPGSPTESADLHSLSLERSCWLAGERESRVGIG